MSLSSKAKMMIKKKKMKKKKPDKDRGNGGPQRTKKTGQTKQTSKSDSDSTKSDSDSGKKPVEGEKSKIDAATGRALFPVDVGGGKIQYFPAAKDATEHEKKQKIFVSNDSIVKEKTNTLSGSGKTVNDVNSGRTLFATKDENNKTEYLPKKSEASPGELSRGKYVDDNAVESEAKGNKVQKDKKPVYEFSNQRNLFATKTDKGETEYLPQKSDATAKELKEGRFVNDNEISQQIPLGAANSMSNKQPKYDIANGRKVYATTNKEGKTVYLPAEESASAFEKAKGLFIPNKTVEQHESKRRVTALKNDEANMMRRRADRAATLPGSKAKTKKNTINEPIKYATDGTKLWDGTSLPKVSEKKQRETLIKLTPKYDLDKERMLYPTETAKGKVEYLPLKEDATLEERIRGTYAALVPVEGLEEFLATAEAEEGIERKKFATDAGNIASYAHADIKAAFEKAPMLVLRQAHLVSDAAAVNPKLQQEHVEADQTENEQPNETADIETAKHTKLQQESVEVDQTDSEQLTEKADVDVAAAENPKLQQERAEHTKLQQESVEVDQTDSEQLTEKNNTDVAVAENPKLQQESEKKESTDS